MKNFTPAEKERLTELLSDDLELFGQIRELMERQTQLLSDDAETFDGLLDRREELAEKINGLHQETDPLMQSYVSSKNSDKDVENLRLKIKAEISYCENLNRQHSSLMKEKTRELSKEIDEKRSKREGIGGYAQAAPTTSMKFDNKA